MGPEIQLLSDLLREQASEHRELSEIDLTEYALPSVRLVTQRVEMDQLGLGESRIGGVPDLPPGIEWPQWILSEAVIGHSGRIKRPKGPAPLGFISQIDLGNLPTIDARLPKTGWLYFFFDRYLDPFGDNLADLGSCRVFYSNCDRSALNRTFPPPDADPLHTAKSCSVKVSAELTLPRAEGRFADPGSPTCESINKISEALIGRNGNVHYRLLGHPQYIHYEAIPYPLIDVPRSDPEFDANKQCQLNAEDVYDWILLLQIDSDIDDTGPGWWWYDQGRLYFFVHARDFANLEFGRVWHTIQCF